MIMIVQSSMKESAFKIYQKHLQCLAAEMFTVKIGLYTSPPGKVFEFCKNLAY